MSLEDIVGSLGYYNKIDSLKPLGVYYWGVKIPQFGYMEHGLKYNMFYIEKHKAPQAMCYDPMLVCDKPLGAPTFVKLVYCGVKKQYCAPDHMGILLITIIYVCIKDLRTQ